jgi:hypothetical protein
VAIAPNPERTEPLKRCAIRRWLVAVRGRVVRMQFSFSLWRDTMYLPLCFFDTDRPNADRDLPAVRPEPGPELQGGRLILLTLDAERR